MFRVAFVAHWQKSHSYCQFLLNVRVWDSYQVHLSKQIRGKYRHYIYFKIYVFNSYLRQDLRPQRTEIKIKFILCSNVIQSFGVVTGWNISGSAEWLENFSLEG